MSDVIYGQNDSSYKAAGELEGITILVDAFYTYMESLEAAQTIRSMHPKNLTLARKKLSYFLSGWLGGPKLYAENFGGISIPGFHRPFAIGDSERDAWLLCMSNAIQDQPYSDSFKTYLYQQLTIPANRIRQVNINAE
jgi:hemoglobin